MSARLNWEVESVLVQVTASAVEDEYADYEMKMQIGGEVVLVLRYRRALQHFMLESFVPKVQRCVTLANLKNVISKLNTMAMEEGWHRPPSQVN